jgi:hypothetical protein
MQVPHLAAAGASLVSPLPQHPSLPAPHLQPVRLELVHDRQVHAAAIQGAEDAEGCTLIPRCHDHHVAALEHVVDPVREAHTLLLSSPQLLPHEAGCLVDAPPRLIVQWVGRPALLTYCCSSCSYCY